MVLRQVHVSKLELLVDNVLLAGNRTMCYSYTKEMTNKWALIKVPANVLIPRQFVGCSCLIRNLQLASLTDVICRREEAGRRTWDGDLLAKV